MMRMWKNFDNMTLQTREIKKFPLFSEHTSYIITRSIFIKNQSLIQSQK